ncbi:MAG: hypothetical protein EOO61_06290 [Hymenobacter sp.]|nr:MAG: hypothetical protein EOO61_06290 [Hymenobacter sp.]
MKSTLLLAAALAFATGAAFAQTVAPGTTPGATTGNPSNMPSAGSPTDSASNAGTGKMNGRGMSGNKRTTKSNGMKIKTKTTPGTNKTNTY